jgi:hypothetical protein
MSTQATLPLDGKMTVGRDNEITQRWLALPNLFNLYLLAKHGLPADWHWWEVTCEESKVPEGFYRFRGDVSRINRKGRRVWDGKRNDALTIFVEVADCEQWCVERARSLNQCVKCHGIGHENVGVSCREPGNTRYTFRECRKCGGSGVFVDVNAAADERQ